MVENIHKQSNWQGINLQNIQIAYSAKYKKKRQKTQSKNEQKI